MMAMLGTRIDLDLNRSAPECSDSGKELMRNAMLQHHATFKYQVRELHRLYWTQNNLMKELCYKDVITAGFPFQPAKGRTSFDPCVDELMGFNVQLPSDSIMRNEKHVNQEVTKTECNASVSDAEFEIDRRSIQHVIDLEEPAPLEDNQEADIISFNSVETPRYDHIGSECIPSVSIPETTNATNNFGLVGCGVNESNNLSKESTGLPSMDHLMQNQRSSSCRLLEIDLNAALDDEFLHASHDPQLVFPSPSTSSSITQQVVVNESHFASHSINAVPKESSNIISKESSVNSALISSKEEDTGALYTTDKMKSNESSWTYDLVEVRNGVLHKESKEIYIKPVEGISNDLDDKAVNGGASKSSAVLCELEERNVGVSVDYQDCVIDGNIKRQLMSRQNSSVTSSSNNMETNVAQASLGSSNLPPCKGIQIKREGRRDDTFSSHTTEDENEQKGASNEYPRNKRAKSTMIEKGHKGVEDSGTTLEDLAGPEICNVDELMIKAAEMLISISLQSSACSLKSLSNGEMQDESEYDLDSFEYLTLNLPESKIEEVFTSTITQKEMNKESCGIKLRRGRGFRDFQKEILPGLVSLSRHEICEDLHNIGYDLSRKCSRGRRRRSSGRLR